MWNLHPFGGLIGDGISPSNILNFALDATSVLGIASNNASVYGCKGLSKIRSAGASYTKLPKYITPIRSEINLTTLKSCVINK